MLQIEALHVWRICANHNEAFMHLDDAYSAICRLFTVPSSSAALNQKGESNLNASKHDKADKSAANQAVTKKVQLLEKLKLEGSCQAYLLLSSLVRHATR